MAENKAPVSCLLCGKIVHKAYLLEHYRTIHNDSAALLSSPTPTGYTLQKLEGFTTRLWAVNPTKVFKGLGYCTACHRTETSRYADPEKIQAEIGAGHVCKPPIPRPGRKKEAQVAKAAGGAGVRAAPTNALVVPYPIMVEAGIHEPAEYDLEDFVEDRKAADLCRGFEKQYEVIKAENAALKAGIAAAAGPAAPTAGSAAEAFARTLAELFDTRGVGKWIREKHAELQKKYEESDGFDPEEPHTARDTILGIVGIARNAATIAASANEENVQMRREMNLMRGQMEQLERKSVALSAIINEQAAKISELEAPLRAQEAVAYAAQRAEIERSMGVPTPP